MKKLISFFTVFTIMNLAFIPLLSYYGLSACPLLHLSGFFVGCGYTAFYIFILNVMNGLFLSLALSKKADSSKARDWIRRHFFPATAGIYLAATLASLGFLQWIFKMNHLDGSSRAPEILALASLLLGITQAYGLHWAMDSKIFPAQQTTSIYKLWLSYIFRFVAPIVIALSVLLHFLLSQSVSFNNGRTAPIENADQVIGGTVYVMAFLVTWLVITYSFYFLSERDQVGLVDTHFKKLKVFELNYRSRTTGSWGLWLGFLNQLNDFSSVLSERTHLLKNFSKFVAKDVAQKALKSEFSDSVGEQKEMTVIMLDIREFTTISDSLSAAKVVTLLNEYFAFVLNIMAQHQIHVDKFMGDGILAYVELGQPNSISENSFAVKGCLEILSRMPEFNLQIKAMNLPPIKIGIGIYRGPLIWGLIGTESKLQHTMIGDTVNRASRLEALTKRLQMQLIVSEEVFNYLDADDKKKFTHLGLQQVRGIKESMPVYGL